VQPGACSTDEGHVRAPALALLLALVLTALAGLPARPAAATQQTSSERRCCAAVATVHGAQQDGAERRCCAVAARARGAQQDSAERSCCATVRGARRAGAQRRDAGRRCCGKASRRVAQRSRPDQGCCALRTGPLRRAGVRLPAPRRPATPRPATPATSAGPGPAPAPAPAGGFSVEGASASGPSPVAEPGGVPVPTTANLGVTAREFSLVLSRRSVPAGPVRVQLVNRGEDPHDLAIAGALAIPQVGPGLTATGTTALAPGTYALVCTLEGHAEAGMRATLTVTSQ
jgi:plastocyanin